MPKLTEEVITAKLAESEAMRDALRQQIFAAKRAESDQVEIAPLFFVSMPEVLKILRSLDSRICRYLSALGFQSTKCSIDCLGAVSDVEDCECACEGAGHGKWNAGARESLKSQPE